MPLLDLPVMDRQDRIATSQVLTKNLVVRSSDFKNWEAVLRDPKNSPVPFMRVQNQRESDCQGQALCSGTEKRMRYCTGKIVQYSDFYAYQASELQMDPRGTYVGRNRGSSIGSGVRVLTTGLPSIKVKRGLPYEEKWPYTVYETRASNFILRARKVEIAEPFVNEVTEMPDWEGMLIGVAAGGSGHIGTYWPPASWDSLNGKKVMKAVPTGSGGHATEIVWAEFINGKWYLIVWNSHNDAFYYMPQKTYESLQKNQFDPFGGYLIMPDKAADRFHDRVSSMGGYLGV